MRGSGLATTAFTQVSPEDSPLFIQGDHTDRGCKRRVGSQEHYSGPPKFYMVSDESWKSTYPERNHVDHQEFFRQGIGLKGYFASIQDRWEGWVTRTKVTGYSTVQGKVLHSNGVSCFTPGRTVIYKH